MKIWIITLFPEYFNSFLNLGIIGSTLKGERGPSFEVNTVSLKEFSPHDFKGVDDAPYGGGPGMVMRVDVLANALLEGVVKKGGYGENFREKLHIVYPSPRGTTLDNRLVKDFAQRVFSGEKDLVFICGRYEGIDERFIQNFVDEEISLGDFVLTGGELATMVILDSTLRFVTGVLGNKESSLSESFQEGLLEHPQYTRPRDFMGLSVPEVLLSGNHKEIEAFKNAERMRITLKYRPELLK